MILHKPTFCSINEDNAKRMKKKGERDNEKQCKILIFFFLFVNSNSLNLEGLKHNELYMNMNRMGSLFNIKSLNNFNLENIFIQLIKNKKKIIFTHTNTHTTMRLSKTLATKQ